MPPPDRFGTAEASWAGNVVPGILLVAIALTLLALGAVTIPEPPSEAESRAGIDLDALIVAHNRERAKAKLPPLQAKAELAAAAGDHARDMAEHRKLSHEGSDGSDPVRRVKRRGYRFRAVGENVAEGPETVEQAMRSWMTSPPHRANILGDFTEAGAAEAPDLEKSHYWCVVFGRPWPRIEPGRDARALITDLNRARTVAKKPAVKEDAALVGVAEEFARDLAARRTIESKNRQGQTPFEILERKGYRARGLASSLASGESDPATVIQSWLAREDQRQDLLGDFGQAGAGVAVDQDGAPYWVLLLARK